MWFIVALLVGAAILGLGWFLHSKGITIKWYEWLIGIIGILLLLFAIQNGVGGFAEFEKTAGQIFLFAFGGVALVIIAVAVGLAWWRITTNKT
ncbi:MAG: dehalogenase [Chloroflexi bacterium]|nr:dehalogenase [Chloroflexota bacterium]